MKLLHYLYIAPLAALLSACNSNEELSATDHPNGIIELKAGIVEGGSAVTRADAETYHGSHHAFKSGVATALALSVRGTWTGKGDAPGSAYPNLVTKSTTATVTSVATGTDDKHNNVNCSPVLYWDDYGTADPDNTAGRSEGLTIYGAAIDGKTTAPTVSDWTALSWTLTVDQTSAGNTPADMDLLISNNVQAASGALTSNDGTYKFDERTNGKLLEFRHAMSKITVNLKAGKGFPVATGETDAHFEETPEVKLTSNEGSATTYTEWPYTTGTVNVTTGDVTNQGGSSKVTMYNAATPMTGWTKTYEALVMPGSAFEGKTSSAADAPYHVIARINADGNIYYVTSEMIRKAINSTSYASETAFPTEAGKNYIINVIVNKTEIKVTATVADWTTVNAEEVAPKINVTVNYGTPGPVIRLNTFSFYRSLALNDGYATGESDELKIGNYYRRVSELTYDTETQKWTMNPIRYWTNHNQHYQFRLVWPNTTTALKTTTESEKPGETVVQKWRPHVEDKTYGGTNYQVIEIWNDKYQEIVESKTMIADDYHPYPSNLMIARPEIDASEQCTNNEPGHTKTYLYDGGICATEGVITLTFRHVMSQVEVNLTTSSDASKVELANAVVEIVNAYKTGDVKLGDREVIPTGEKVSYIIDPVTIVADKPETTDVNENTVSKNKRHSAIVPQPLEGVKFKITITNTHDTEGTSDDTQDVYYADVAPIKRADDATKLVAPNGKWESGYHYVYNLNLSKTRINVIATIADWNKVEAAEEVWF